MERDASRSSRDPDRDPLSHESPEVVEAREIAFGPPGVVLVDAASPKVVECRHEPVPWIANECETKEPLEVTSAVHDPVLPE